MLPVQHSTVDDRLANAHGHPSRTTFARTIAFALAVANVGLLGLATCTSTRTPIPESQLKSLDAVSTMIAREPTLELYDARIDLYREAGDTESLRKALADVDSAEALGAATQWKQRPRYGDYTDSFRQHRVAIHCALFSRTNVESEQTACLAGVDDIVRREPDTETHIWRARLYAENGGDPAKVEESLREAKRLSARAKKGTSDESLLHYRCAQIYDVLTTRAAGTPAEVRFKELAEEARREWKVARAIEGPDAEERLAASAAAAEKERAEEARREAGRLVTQRQGTQQNLDRQRTENEEREKGIAQHGACPFCEGSGKILWVPPQAFAETGPAHAARVQNESRLEPCGKCRGTGYKGSGYSILNPQ